jgi:hypothetical protein
MSTFRGVAEQNVDLPDRSWPKSTFCTVAVQNVDRGRTTPSISTFCSDELAARPADLPSMGS